MCQLKKDAFEIGIILLGNQRKGRAREEVLAGSSGHLFYPNPERGGSLFCGAFSSIGLMARSKNLRMSRRHCAPYRTIFQAPSSHSVSLHCNHYVQVKAVSPISAHFIQLLCSVITHQMEIYIQDDQRNGRKPFLSRHGSTFSEAIFVEGRQTRRVKGAKPASTHATRERHPLASIHACDRRTTPLMPSSKLADTASPTSNVLVIFHLSKIMPQPYCTRRLCQCALLHESNANEPRVYRFTVWGCPCSVSGWMTCHQCTPYVLTP